MALKVDEFLATQTLDRQMEFDNMCQHHAYGTDLYRKLKDWGAEISYQTVCNWYQQRYPVGAEVKQINAKAMTYRGVDLKGVEEYGVARLFNLIELMLVKMDTFAHRLDDDKVFDKLPNYLHQWRGLIASLREAKQKADASEIALTVSEEVIAEFVLTFASTPIEDSINEAARGVRRKVKERWG